MSLPRLLRASKSSPLPFSRPFTAMSTRSLSRFIVNPTELSTALHNPPRNSKIIPLSAEWYLPNDSRKGRAEFLKLRIPGARFFDLDAVKGDSPYPHMLPDPQTFANAMSELGITREDTLVVYDSPHIGIFSAPRVAWTLKVFGHPRVHLLNNFKLWAAQGLPTESGEVKEWEKTEYAVPQMDYSVVVDFEEMVTHAEMGTKEGVEIIDARPNGRFLGIDPEPRPGLSSGHVPGAVSIPFSELVDPVTKTLKTAAELHTLFLEKGIDASAKTDKILMCGTGVTAVIVDAALELAGIEGKRRIYDGSWTEWAQRVDEKSGLIVKKPQ